MVDSGGPVLWGGTDVKVMVEGLWMMERLEIAMDKLEEGGEEGHS